MINQTFSVLNAIEAGAPIEGIDPQGCLKALIAIRWVDLGMAGEGPVVTPAGRRALETWARAPNARAVRKPGGCSLAGRDRAPWAAGARALRGMR